MKLTNTEREVVSLLSQDKTVQEIANIRGRSPSTVRVQVSSLKLKLGVGTDHGAVGKFLMLML
jgi:DNA-binding CsgD family transcriptional regulator